MTFDSLSERTLFNCTQWVSGFTAFLREAKLFSWKVEERQLNGWNKRKGFLHSMATGSVLLHFQLEAPEERRWQISITRPFKFVVALEGWFCSDTTDAFSKADFQRRLSILSFISTVAFILRRTLTVSAIPWRAAMCKGVAPLQSLSSTRAPFLMSNVELVDHVINFL